MKSTIMLTAALAALPALTPVPAAAQDCNQAIAAVDRKIGQVEDKQAWYRAQIQLYIAEQFMGEDDADSCMQAAERASRIVTARLPAGAEDDVTTAVDRAGRSPEASSGGKQPQASGDGPAGANITGLDSEGWGTNEAQGTPPPKQEASAAPAGEQASVAIGTPVETQDGEKLGKVVDVPDPAVGHHRYVIDTGTKRVPIPAEALKYRKGDAAAVADVTKEEVKEALPLQGGTETGSQPTGTAGGG